jgi:rubrerythrin
MRLIDADNLKEDLNAEIIFDSRDRCRVRNLIDFQLTIEAEPVRRGHWKADTNDKWVCSECGVGNLYAYSWDITGYKLQDRYCPNCGAKMGEYE